MNQVLIEIAKAIETGLLDAEQCAIVLQFVVEKKRTMHGSQDENILLAEAIRRALVDADTEEDYCSVSEVIESMRP